LQSSMLMARKINIKVCKSKNTLKALKFEISKQR
jgi:hypothetical protein